MGKMLISIIISIILAGVVFAADPVAWWKFDKIDTKRVEVKMVRGETFVPREVMSYVYESVTDTKLDLFGKYNKSVAGVNGKAALLDGYTTYIEMPGDEAPTIADDFTVEAWVALGALPKHWCPIVDHQRDVNEGYFNGYFFGFDANGRVMFRIATDGKNEVLTSAKPIKINTWTHVAGVYSDDDGLKIFIDGEMVAQRKPDDKFTPVKRKRSILVGKSRTKHRPYGTIRPHGTAEAYTFLDGILDDVKIYDDALSSSEVKKAYTALKTNKKPELPVRKLPTGPLKAEKFGAFNTTLDYYAAWDAPWQVHDNADIVVRFDETPCEFIFWRGTNYIPNWVTGNGIWFNNGFNEGWNDHGSCEPMSDKRCRHSSVKIVESNAARVVVQWRYALVDNWLEFAFVDPSTGWGDWTNETFTIYPDMVGVREDVLLSNAPRAAHEWQESIMVMGPGQRPDEVLQLAALSLANIKGESHTWSWEHETPPHIPKDPPNANIQVVNTQSKYHPFSVIRPQDEPMMDIYSGEIRRDVCVFPWWNHWPVAPRPTDGRYSMNSDRASHASLSHWNWKEYEQTDYSMTKLMLTGMTAKKAEELVPLAKSWSNPAKLNLADASQGSAVYDPTELAWIIDLKSNTKPVAFEVKATNESPMINPAFVVLGWGNKSATLEMDGKNIPEGNDCRFGYRESLDGKDLIIWIRTESEKTVKFSVK